ncbi:MAG TPA: hypothetical protein DEO33_04475 [Rikenellaceae bacterium]|nr:hypothetical protein [Rikenellaceae bacterium]
MRDTQLFQVAEISSDWNRVERVDLSKKENVNLRFSFSDILRDRDIDHLVGRNRMLSFLRIYGILTSQNKLNPKSYWTRYFSTKNTSTKSSLKTIEVSYQCLCISGVGILLLRRAIEMVRERGGSL